MAQFEGRGTGPVAFSHPQGRRNSISADDGRWCLEDFAATGVPRWSGFFLSTIWAARFASDLLDAGVDIVTVQKLAGHASPVTTAFVRSPGRRNQTTGPAALRVLILRVESSSQIFLSQPIHPNQAILYILKNRGV
ncbi:hypothetical protein Q5692_32285 [Microcoleus sp. C2C3]|uniref:hypothetical protein n=1 Tax=unclassified Microcoleus TaxID=2642155 RepID=UPI002FD48DBE